jgi:Zn-finger nucleic acid-binding protein
MTPWLTSICPNCGVTAVLRRLDNVRLHDCECTGSSNPWRDVPEGTLVIWKEKPHKKEWEKLFNLYQLGILSKEEIIRGFKLDSCPDGCLVVQKEALL